MVNISEINGYGIYAQTASLANTASYIDHTFISASSAAFGFSTDTGSLLTTASVSLNTITFTKGDGSTFPITVDTGSGGGGGGGSITVEDQGISLGTATVFNFTGSGVTSSLVSSTASIRVNSSYDLPLLSVTETASRLDDWSPMGWPGENDVIKVIHLDPNNSDKIIMLGGLTSGSVGKIVTLHNSSSNSLLVIENQSTSSSLGNRFSMMQQSAYFLLPGRDVTFLYNGFEWSQFSTTNNFGGFDFVDDMTNGPQTAVANVITNLYQFIGSVAGTNANGAEAGDFGVIQLSTLTSATSNIIGAMGTRTGGNTFVSNNPSFPVVLLSKIQVPTVPSALQDFAVQIGLIFTSTTSFTGPGIYWNLPASTSTSGSWRNTAVNSTNTLNTITESPIPDTSTGWLYLGIYADGTSPNINYVYFYSLDGIIYNFSSRFTRTASEFGGKPFIRIAKTAGTTARTLLVDWSGISFNRNR